MTKEPVLQPHLCEGSCDLSLGNMSASGSEWHGGACKVQALAERKAELHFGSG